MESYLSLTRLYDQTHFNCTEQQTILLSISRYRNCCYCQAAHGTVAKMQKTDDEIIRAVYYKQQLTDNKLAALRDFTLAVLEQQSWVK